VQLLPLLILFGLSLLSSLPSLFATPPTPDPHFAFNPTTKYNTEMETGGLGVHYFVNKGEFAGHPTIGAEMAREGVKIGRVLEEVITEHNKDSNSKDPKDTKDSKTKTKTRQVVRGKGKQRGPALSKFEDTVDRIYTQDLLHNCRSNVERKERAKEAEIGVFGLGTDWEKVKRIDAEVIESCEELKRLGVLSR
jgi:DnaJ family protein B protein 12